jgi:hypothetical protein
MKDARLAPTEMAYIVNAAAARMLFVGPECSSMSIRQPRSRCGRNHCSSVRSNAGPSIWFPWTTLSLKDSTLPGDAVLTPTPL